MEPINIENFPSENQLEGANEINEPSRTSRGFKLIGLGAVVLLISCIITMVSSISHPWYNYVLYGVTSGGVVVVFCGLYFVFE